MRQYRVYRCHGALALMMQSHLVPRPTPFTLVAPVIPFGDFPPIPKLDIEVLVEGKIALAMISQLTSVQTAAIGGEVADLDAHADTFRVAMDFLTQGF